MWTGKMASTPASRSTPPEDAAAPPTSFPNAFSWFAATCQQPARAPAAVRSRKGAGFYVCMYVCVYIRVSVCIHTTY